MSAELDVHSVIRPARYRPPGGVLNTPAPRLPWGRLMAGAAVLIVFWALWFVLSARSVGIEPVPASASVSVLEWPAIRVGNHWLLRPGARRVIVEAPGHTPFQGDIDVTASQLQTHEVVLTRLPGNLRVRVTPGIESELFIDGAFVGDVPGLVENIEAGAREVEVRAPRYLSYRSSMDVEGKGIEQTLDVVLQPAWATVALDSVPSEAAVSVDGESVGTTPLSIELLQGRRVVEIRAAGYKRWRQTLNIVPGTDVALGEVVLAKADGVVRVTSKPEGANVTVDGEFRGRTPLDVVLTPDDAHKLQFIKQGYLPAERSVSVASAARDTLELELKPELAKIHFRTSPAEAELLVDGELRGNATQSLDLATHEHTITVRAPGFATFETKITPRKGTEKRYRIRLKTAAEMAADGKRRRAPSGAPPKGMLTTSAGQELKLFTGGPAVLGTGNSAPGHRANEPQRSVRLERPFYVALKEVTNAEYRAFLAAHDSGTVSGSRLDDDRQPVVNVSWTAAALYCNWLSRRDGLAPFYQIRYGEVLGVQPDSTGYRLPTEAEWEWAARIPPQGEPTVFPWGNRYPPRGRSANFAGGSAAVDAATRIKGYDDGFAVSAPVGSFPANLRGLYDLDGNVAEWTNDYYDERPSTTQGVDPVGPAAGETHVVKGGSWAAGSVEKLRAAYREPGNEGSPSIGFRIARYAR